MQSTHRRMTNRDQKPADSARKTQSRNKESGIPRNCTLDELLRLADVDPICATRKCENRMIAVRQKSSDVRRENMAVGIRIHQRIRRDPDLKRQLADRLERKFGRELSRDKLLRDIYISMGVDDDTAGTDATALQEALRRQITALEIPRYIREAGGISALLDNERKRKRASCRHQPQRTQSTSNSIPNAGRIGANSDRQQRQSRPDRASRVNLAGPRDLGIFGTDEIWEEVERLRGRNTRRGVLMGRDGDSRLYIVEVDPGD